MSYPQFGHPIGGNFDRVCAIHHRAHPIARTPAHAATAAIASSDNTNQISSGQLSIPNLQFDLANYTCWYPASNTILPPPSCPLVSLVDKNLVPLNGNPDQPRHEINHQQPNEKINRRAHPQEQRQSHQHPANGRRPRKFLQCPRRRIIQNSHVPPVTLTSSV